jgi:RNA polymerase sigma-70 factor (TIGR02957 family)
MPMPPEAALDGREGRDVGVADYLQFRSLMFSIAYRMTGSVSDAEDIVQEAYLRLTRALRDGARVASPKAYLATVTTRLAITHLRSARVRREAYVGTWLPEPLVEGGLDPVAPATAPDPAERAEMSDSLSMAFLVLLESLTPTERAVFLLHEVFGYDYAEIAEITGKSEPNCRQIFTRARHHIDEGKPRFEASRAQRDEVASRFFDAVNGGDLNSLLELLAPDVVVMGDGGGKAQARREPTHGAERVARFLLGLFRRAQKEGLYGEPAVVNGQPGAVAYDAEGRVVSVFALDIADGLVQAVRSVVNPDKLQHLGPTSDLYLRSDGTYPGGHGHRLHRGDRG